MAGGKSLAHLGNGSWGLGVTPELKLDAQGIPELVFPSGRRLAVDLIGDRAGYGKSLRGKQEMIAKACGLSGGALTVLDTTLGLGQDTWTLSRLGCRVVGCEREPLLFQLFSKALERASLDPRRQEIVSRIQVFNQEAMAFMSSAGAPRVDTVFLDPMFPDLKKSALPKIEMQMLRDWLGHGNESDGELLAAARAYPNRGEKFRVVVKRPSKAPTLASDFFHQFIGKSIRYDCYKGTAV